MPLYFLRRQFYNYFQEFLHDSRAIGVLLFGCTVISMVLANLSFGQAYAGFFTHEVHFFETLHLPHSLVHWINDGLMAIFFFLVGMEIKRELTVGELSSVKRAVLPIAAAIGGMIVPALFYLFFNHGTPTEGGWGIPMATDIAFSLGVASMLGKKVPVNLKIFLTALAIIDDLGAILVIALFYGQGVKAIFLLGAMVVLGVIWILNKRGIPFGKYQFLLGALLWYLVFNSGIHATIAGVLLAFMVPQNMLSDLEHKLHNYVNFGILPLFALANTAIIIQVSMIPELKGLLSLGIIVGLFAGKPVGVMLASWIMVKAKVAELPRGVNWMQMAGAGILAGIGFTMSIFITCLAFTEIEVQDIGKIAILLAAVGSILASVIWFWIGSKISKAPVKNKPVQETEP
ncbi:MAG: Na+/H+ antiporter NhaA [Chitinophagaceae bacterium]|nr:Na+/H+ antiporter NhaA [Chitinophagaceae bacterium]